MSNEYLMKPRYLVRADYPNPTNTPYVFRKGDIVVFDKDTSVLLWKEPSNDGTLLSEDYFQKYPEIFVKIKWWYKRDANEMPEYIKWNYNVGWIVYKIPLEKYLDRDYMRWKFGGNTLDNFLPSTEQEYNDYTNKKNR